GRGRRLAVERVRGAGERDGRSPRRAAVERLHDGAGGLIDEIAETQPDGRLAGRGVHRAANRHGADREGAERLRERGPGGEVAEVVGPPDASAGRGEEERVRLGRVYRDRVRPARVERLVVGAVELRARRLRTEVEPRARAGVYR